MLRHNGIGVWCFDGTDWIAARTEADATAYERKLAGHDDLEAESTDLLTEHWREWDCPERGKCTLLATLIEHLDSGGRLPFAISSTEY